MKRRMTGAGIALVLLLAMAAPAGAQAPRGRRGGEEGGRAELREAMREHFQNRLRAEVSLTDDQARHILPRVRQLEESKTALRRSHMEATRQLRRGLEQGATDEELQELLDSLARGGREQQELERSLMYEVDDVLSARQRVQLRFFLHGFRQQMQRKVRELRGDWRRDSRQEQRRNGP